jgi:hypothetical protein
MTVLMDVMKRIDVRVENVDQVQTLYLDFYRPDPGGRGESLNNCSSMSAICTPEWKSRYRILRSTFYLQSRAYIAFESLLRLVGPNSRGLHPSRIDDLNCYLEIDGKGACRAGRDHVLYHETVPLSSGSTTREPRAERHWICGGHLYRAA